MRTRRERERKTQESLALVYGRRLRRGVAGAVIVAALAGCAGSGVVLSRGPSSAVSPGRAEPGVDIPPGHYPPPGSCRIWVPGVPPGQQAPPGDCEELRRQVPRGGVLVRG